MEPITVDVLAVRVPDEVPLHEGGPDRYDYSRLPENLRNQAKLAQGTVLTKLTGAVDRVIDAGNTLRWAKATLPHGEYLPWVQQACGLRPSYAAKLINAAELVNVEHVPHLSRVTDTATLFLLSADATPEDVREWFFERCAAGDVPSRAEVAERKRCATGKPAAPRPVELQALTMYRKAQTADTEAALLLARQITTVSEAELLAELGLRELPKAKVLHAMDADFHRRPDGSGWDRVPHSGRVEVGQQASPDPDPLSPPAVLTAAEAAEVLGVKESSLKNMLTPSRAPDGCGMVGGRKVKRHGPNAYVLL